jgi:hypothetical protein
MAKARSGGLMRAAVRLGFWIVRWDGGGGRWTGDDEVAGG